MPVYFFWGEDDFRLTQAVKQLQESVLDPNWLQFNYDKLSGEKPELVIEALNQAMTPVFGVGDRLVWLHETTICQHCSQELLSELERTLPVIPSNSHLLFTTSKKPDRRTSATKLVQKYAKFQEFTPIPPWKTDAIAQQVEELAHQQQVQLTPAAVEALANAVGNDTRRLWTELEKLSLYAGESQTPLDVSVITALVSCHTQSSLQLATAIRKGDTHKALGLVTDLLNRNEPSLKIVATLVGQFRTWLIVKLMLKAGEKNEKAIASAAGINNPKRLYFIRQEIKSLSVEKLVSIFDLLLDLEFKLKRGYEPLSTLQRVIVELCQMCQ